MFCISVETSDAVTADKKPEAWFINKLVWKWYPTVWAWPSSTHKLLEVLGIREVLLRFSRLLCKFYPLMKQTFCDDADPDSHETDGEHIDGAHVGKSLAAGRWQGWPSSRQLQPSLLHPHPSRHEHHDAGHPHMWVFSQGNWMYFNNLPGLLWRIHQQTTVSPFLIHLTHSQIIPRLLPVT